MGLNSTFTRLSRILIVLCLIHSTVDAQSLQLGCDTGWTHISGKCYLIVPHNHSWPNAKDYCSKYGAVLAEPKGYEVSQTLYNEASSLGVKTYWIGYNRVDHETEDAKVGYWSDGRSTGVEVGVWAPRQPNIAAGSCGYVTEPMGDDTYARWYIGHCNNIYPFVCERNPCPVDGHTCSNGRCVSFETLCNGANDCGDGSDEQSCDSLCNEYYSGTSGSISITNTDKYVANMNCVYTITTGISRRIQIQFTAFDTEEKLDVLEIWDGGATIVTSTLMARLSGTDVDRYQTFISSTNHLILRFFTDGTMQKSGFNITWSSEFQCKVNKVSNFKVLDGQTRDILSLTPRQSVQDCVNDCSNRIDCWGFTYDVSYDGKKTCSILTEPPVIERDTCCEFYAKTCPGQQGDTSLTDLPLATSSLEATQSAKYLYTPLYPFYYIGNIELKYTITTSGNNLITLQIKKIDLCCSDSASVHDGTGPSAARLATINKSSSPGFVLSTGQAMYIHMDLRTHWTCTGIIMTYKQGCSIELTSNSGVVMSPGYGAADYPGISECTWQIAPPAGNSVRLKFEDFQTETNMDYLQIIREDDVRTSIHTGLGYHGDTLPEVLTSANNITLIFKTSAVTSARGFRAVYSSGCPSFEGAGLVVEPAAASFHAPDVVHLSCGEGFTFGGNHVGVTSLPLVCGDSGQWNLTSQPFCEQSYCGLAPDLVNGYAVMASGVLGGDIIQFACNDQYDLIGQQFVTCQSDGNWDQLPECKSTQCPLLTGRFPASNLTFVKGNGTEQGSIVQVTCPQYQELIGPRNIVCNQGEWRSSIPYCQPIPCPVPAIVNGFVNMSQTFTLNSLIYMECDSGFAIQSSPIIRSDFFRCGLDTPPTCNNINECTIGIDMCIGATCHDTDGSYKCTCLPGYRHVGTSTTFCEDIDECSLNTDFCDLSCTNTAGSYECSCADGYDLYTSVNYNGFELGPGEDGLKPWHQFYLNHSCVLKTCDSSQISNINNGVAKTSKSVFFYGDQVEFVCNIGFWTAETGLSRNTVTCRSNGTWNTRPLCEPAFCNETFTNTDVQPTGTITYGDRYTLRCTMLNGEIKVLERSCGFDKVSQTYRTFGPELQCPDTDCGPIPQPDGMQDFVTMCTTYNCTVPFECKPQYVRRGTGSIWAPFIVICTEEGVWDFGSLHCEGGQCPDPGYPANGLTTLTTWGNYGTGIPTVQNGSVASFSCVKDGYFPSPNANLTCRPDGNAMNWEGPLPECVDLTPPVFTNCPFDMTVRSFGRIDFTVPSVSDNTAVKTLRVFPDNFQPGTTAFVSLNANYLAEDFAGNTAICSFRVIIEDVTSPRLTCGLPPVITASPGNVVDPLQYVTTDDPLTEIRSIPNSVPAGYTDVGSNPVIQFVSTDNSNNMGTCRNQMKIIAPKCNPDTLHVYNGNIECQISQPGYSCEVTCLDNYVFYEDPTQESLYVSCSFGGEWSREMPICTAKDLAFYRVVSEFEYVLSTTVRADESCGALYEEQIRTSNNLITVTNAFTELCKGISEQLDVSPAPINAIDAQINDEGTLVAVLSVDIRPEGLQDSLYTLCATEILRAISEKKDAVSTIETLAGGGSGIYTCPEATLKSSSTNQQMSSFACSNAGTAAEESPTKHICLACPPGTFRDGFGCSPCPAGTYNDGYYKDACTPCPDGTNSLSTGLMYLKSCYADCVSGLYSSNGKAPCRDCPRDTYWTNSTVCTPCPSNTHTRASGALSPDECLAECEIGEFSTDGLQPCNPCPKHFFQGSRNAEVCVECNTDEVTTTVGSTSSQDCIDGFSLVCLSPNPCSNGGVCSVVRHEFLCTCSEGYTGRRCETAVGSCDLDPCYNGGTCVQINPTQHTCECAGTFSGDNCEIDGNDCTDVICQNNGTCIDKRESFECACPSYSGYYGTFCELMQDPCNLYPCNNAIQCVAQQNYFRVCDCMDGFTGVNCEIDLNECSSNPCMNGGTCQDAAGTFRCVCEPGFQGKYCHLRNYTGLCGGNVCANGGTCVDDYIAEERFCVCQHGWYYDEPSGVCGVLVQFCDGLDCGTNGECFTYDGGYNVKCKCEPGYAGQSCVTNVDDCGSYPCQNRGVCRDGINEFSCNCTLNGTGGPTCTDNVNDCANCVNVNTQTCHDFINDYTCYCIDGYTGTNCETKIPGCASLPCQHNGTCVDAVDLVTYNCACAFPWTGANCESEIDFCADGTGCGPEGTCISTSNGSYCACSYGYRGARCEDIYDVCTRLKPCVGNSTCLDIPPLPICTCESGYTGTSCESLVWFCTDTTCQNGGTCAIDDTMGVVCACQEGFTSSDCSVNIDECASDVCPPNSVCIDGIATYTCVCQNGKIGENCLKDFSYSFDYVINQFYRCNDVVTYSPFTLTNTTAISIALWLRFTDIVATDSIFTIYGSHSGATVTSDNWASRLSVNSTYVTFDLRLPNARQLSGVITMPNTNFIDGLWHHLAITWSNVDGIFTLYKDGSYFDEIFFAENEVLPQIGWTLLGSEVGSLTFFTGRISRFLIFDSKLNDTAVFRVVQGGLTESSILDQSSLMLMNSVDYNSQFANGVCTALDNCPDKPFSVNALPVVASCPDDWMVVSERVSRPQWPVPVFTNTDSSSQRQTHVSGGTDLGWGIYGLGFAEYTTDNRYAAVCSYRFYNRRSTCTAVSTQSGMTSQCVPPDTDDTLRCSIDCDASDYTLSVEAPVYHTCSKYGMWDRAERMTQYIYPACTPAIPPSIQLITSVDYNTNTNCDTIRSELGVNITRALTLLNGKWNNGLCLSANGDSDASCGSVDVQVACVDQTTRVTVTISYLSAEVRSGSSSQTSPENALKIGFADDTVFSFEPVAAPVMSTLVVSPVRTCPEGHGLVNDMCVKCGSGTYFNMTLSACPECPAGSYRTVTDRTDILSECTQCPGSETTVDQGSQTNSSCFPSCYFGDYYNTTTHSCQPCAIGFYTDVIGMQYCKPCGVGETTRAVRSRQVDCIPLSRLTTTATPGASTAASTGTEDGGLSGGIIAVIVICTLILLLLLILLILCITKKLPCFSDKVVPGETPWKHVNKYGETNLRHVNYRLSDIKEKKQPIGDRRPIYPEPVSPDDSLSLQTDISVHVPVFVEKLNGSITRKNVFVSNGRASDLGSDLDRTIGSEKGGYSESGRFGTSMRSDRGLSDTNRLGTSLHSESEFYVGPNTLPVRKHKHHRRGRKGRPPADLKSKGGHHPRTLSPLAHTSQVPVVPQSSEYVRPMPSFSHHRPEVLTSQYEEFLEARLAKEASDTTPPNSQSSERILLDSDDDDYR